MSDGFSEKEILIELMRETKAQSKVLSTLEAKAESIEKQTIKTNGRVTKLEDKMSDVERVQEGVAVKVAGFVFFVSLLVSAVIASISHKLFP